MSELQQTLREYLIKIAKTGKPVNYGKFAADNGFNWFDDQFILKEALATIIDYDHANNLPLLSSLVIRLDDEIGNGFWRKLNQLKIPVTGKLEFLAAEWNKVFDHYKKT